MDTTCIGCGQTDDHPKHRFAATPRGEQRCFHLDCPHTADGDANVDMGCPTCPPQTAAKGELRGDAFRAQLVEYAQAREYLQATGGAEFDHNGLLIEGSTNA